MLTALATERGAGTDLDGRGDWIRTSDLPLPKRTRYQASLRPDLPILPQSSFRFALASVGLGAWFLVRPKSFRPRCACHAGPRTQDQRRTVDEELRTRDRRTTPNGKTRR